MTLQDTYTQTVIELRRENKELQEQVDETPLLVGLAFLAGIILGTGGLAIIMAVV